MPNSGWKVPAILSGGVAPSTLLNSLKGYWKLGEASGTRADSSGLGYDLSPTGTVTNAVGVSGNAANFAGGGLLSIANNADLATGQVDFFVNIWYYHVSGTGKVIACKTQISPSSAREWTLTVDSGNPPRFDIDIWNTSGGVQSLNASENGAIDRTGVVIPNSWNLFQAGYRVSDDKIWIRGNGWRKDAARTVALTATAAAFGIGAYSDNGAGNITGRVDEVGFWKKTPTDIELCALSNGGKGITHPFNAGVDTGPNNIICHGDSLTYGYNLTYDNAYPAQLPALLGRYCVTNIGHTGAAVSDATSEAITYVDPQYVTGGGKQVVVIWIGINDLMVSGVNPTTVYNSISAYCAARRSTGFKVVVGTITPQIGNGTNGNFAADRATLNGLITAGWSGFADALADIGADATIGGDTAPNDATYYQAADKLHLTAAGYAIVASIVKDAINTL